MWLALLPGLGRDQLPLLGGRAALPSWWIAEPIARDWPRPRTSHRAAAARGYRLTTYRHHQKPLTLHAYLESQMPTISFASSLLL